MKLTTEFNKQFEHPIQLTHISPHFTVEGELFVPELNCFHYFATAVKQRFILNEQQNPVGKSCYKCGNMYTLDDFYTDRNALFNKTTSCKYCRSERDKQFRQDNPSYYRRYFIDNRDKLLASVRQWARNNTDKVHLYAARHAERRKEALMRCYPDDKEYMKLINSEPKCVITGTTDGISLDHILPVTRGRWGNNRGNLMWLSELLNISKGSKNVFEWMDSMEQEILDALLPEGHQMPVEEFRLRLTVALSQKAAEMDLSLAEYEELYHSDYS